MNNIDQTQCLIWTICKHWCPWLEKVSYSNMTLRNWQWWAIQLEKVQKDTELKSQSCETSSIIHQTLKYIPTSLPMWYWLNIESDNKVIVVAAVVTHLILKKSFSLCFKAHFSSKFQGCIYEWHSLSPFLTAVWDSWNWEIEVNGFLDKVRILICIFPALFQHPNWVFPICISSRYVDFVPEWPNCWWRILEPIYCQNLYIWKWKKLL